jgi:mannose-1-phosphate guanylyltransferase
MAVWAVILAGGVGSRFWPLSRAARPKQLLDLFGEGALLRVTSERIAPLVPFERQVVVTGAALAAAVESLCPELPRDLVLAEPTGRNTAAAIGWAAHQILRRDAEAVLAVLPSDHRVEDTAGFLVAARQATEIAQAGRIVTIGVRPTRPETGYGYIRRGPALGDGAYVALGFAEKPDLETAERYLASGDYAWNAGMFFLRADRIIRDLETFEPELGAGLGALSAEPGRLAEIYPTLRSISIDYAVMERISDLVVIPAELGWSDVGSWRTLFDLRPDGAASFAQGEVLELDGGGNVLVASGGMIAAVGVSDLIIVHTPDATLVLPREQAQRVREVVTKLEALGRSQHL